MDVSSADMYTGGLIGMILSAGPMAKAVMVILLFFSIVAWTIIFMKYRQYSRTEAEGERFFRAVKEADSFKKLISVYRDSQDNAFYRLVLACYKEVTSRQKDNPGRIRREDIPAIEDMLRIAISDESVKLERRLSFLATTANTAPFIGLFGTVWGIMDSFREIGVRGTTSLAVVAPGISEALIATALGLATAIPAVLAYNYFLGRLKRILSRMENAAIYLVNILEK
ncbi:MAG: Biopolymer transport protein ExbB [Syntrophorhabdus sp. PtaB.Bin047]|jgi:biopolymer transport protein TolQ|nr:MAG: Biopolymer transport protein ExbB [Syntrophorhabdus sp. PtaB.Bin047]